MLQQTASKQIKGADPVGTDRRSRWAESADGRDHVQSVSDVTNTNTNTNITRVAQYATSPPAGLGPHCRSYAP